MINAKDLPKIVLAAQKRFHQLEIKYPELEAYLVFSSQYGQTSINSSTEAILQEFPKMLVDDQSRKLAFRKIPIISSNSMNLSVQESRLPSKWMRSENRMSALKRKIAVLERKMERDKLALRELLARVEIVPDVNIEIRFSQLKYKLVWHLQKDELVDRELTPQSRASIRIVLGGLGEFSKVSVVGRKIGPHSQS